MFFENTICPISRKCRFHRECELFFPDETGRKRLQRDFSHECLATSDDFNRIGASERRGQFNVTLYIYISRVYDIAVLIQNLDGGAERTVTRCQGVAVKIEDGHRDRHTGPSSIVWLSPNICKSDDVSRWISFDGCGRQHCHK